MAGLLMKEQAWADVIASVDWLKERYSPQFTGYVTKRERTLMTWRERAVAHLGS